MSDFLAGAYFMCANSEGSGETAQMRRPDWAFAGRLCDKYHNLMSLLKLFPQSPEKRSWRLYSPDLQCPPILPKIITIVIRKTKYELRTEMDGFQMKVSAPEPAADQWSFLVCYQMRTYYLSNMYQIWKSHQNILEPLFVCTKYTIQSTTITVIPIFICKTNLKI